MAGTQGERAEPPRSCNRSALVPHGTLMTPNDGVAASPILGLRTSRIRQRRQQYLCPDPDVRRSTQIPHSRTGQLAANKAYHLRHPISSVHMAKGGPPLKRIL